MSLVIGDSQSQYISGTRDIVWWQNTSLNGQGPGFDPWHYKINKQTNKSPNGSQSPQLRLHHPLYFLKNKLNLFLDVQSHCVKWNICTNFGSKIAQKCVLEPNLMWQVFKLAVERPPCSKPEPSKILLQGTNRLAGHLPVIWWSLRRGVLICCQSLVYQKYHHTIFYKL
jgi:hypothetical protein